MNLITLETVGSTNDYCMEHPEILSSPGTVIKAIDQTKGRGRHSKSWSFTRGKDIAFSLIHHPDCAIEDISIITVLTGIAIRRALYIITGLDFTIKWPNDILHEGKKICGILVETAPSRTDAVLVIGIGINTNSDTQNTFPGAVSLKSITGEEYDIDALIEAVVIEVTAILTPMRLDDTQIAEWNSVSNIIGRNVSFSGSDSILTGIVSGIDKHGALVILTPDGEEVHYSGEIDYAG